MSTSKKSSFLTHALRFSPFMIFFRPVKTTNHVHPVLNHNNITAQNQDLKKKATTSPASTLSDKGIG